MVLGAADAGPARSNASRTLAACDAPSSALLPLKRFRRRRRTSGSLEDGAGTFLSHAFALTHRSVADRRLAAGISLPRLG